MARYTMELREVISVFGREEVKNWFKDYELADYLTTEQISVINNAGVWDKDKLAERIVDHFYLREICTDAPGSFMLFTRDKMREVMERYAPVLYSMSIKYDPLNTINIKEEFERESSTTGRANSTSNGNSSGLTVSSDTPQGRISKSAILAGDYASSTSANENESTASDSSTSAGTGNEKYIRTTSGMSGQTAQKLIEEYRKNIVNLNSDIIYALEPLFMAIY